MNEPILERIEKRLERLEEKVDTIMINCIPTLQAKVERLSGNCSVLSKLIIGIAIGMTLAVIALFIRG